MRISTLSSPNSETSGASKEAHEALGVSLVPLRASVRMEIFRFGLFVNARRIVSILAASDANTDRASSAFTDQFYFFEADI